MTIRTSDISLDRSHTAANLDSVDRGETWLARFRDTLVGLQCKTTVLVVALLVMVVVVLCGLTVGQAWRLTTRLESDQALQQAATVAAFAAGPLGKLQYDELQRATSRLITGRHLRFVCITDPEGRVLAVADQSGQSGQPDERKYCGPNTSRELIGVPIVTRTADNSSDSVQVTYPISSERQDLNRSHNTGRQNAADGRRQLLGYVHVGMDRGRTIAEFDAAADLVVGIGIAIVLISIPAVFIVVRRIVVPLNEMSRVANRFSAGQLNARSSVQRSDEIGTLAANFNAMADEIGHTHQQVVALNSELEQRVMERTAQLRELAAREPLTGLYNRRHFSEVLSRRFSEARRYGTDLSLMMIDMDNFKNINDRFGHLVGDEILIMTALTISSQLRAPDLAARFGGDEFIVLMPHTSHPQADHVARRVIRLFDQEQAKKDLGTPLSLSIGVASLGCTDAKSDDDLVRFVDRALYDAKKLGKNRVSAAEIAVQ